jgi:hypothetical protein
VNVELNGLPTEEIRQNHISTDPEASTGKRTLHFRNEGADGIHSPLPSTGLDEQALQDVLDSRPTLQLGRTMSVRYRGGSAFTSRPESSRSRDRAYTSLQERARSAPGNKEGGNGCLKAFEQDA